MIDILEAILDFLSQRLSFGGISALLLACALVYIWFQYHRVKLFEERLNLAEERRVALRDELERVSEQAKEKTESRRTVPESARQVLVVEDDPTLRELLSLLVSDEIPDILVVPASDGEEALQHIAGHTPSLLILDIFMPRKSGFDVLREVARSDQRFPIIVVSGYYAVKEAIAEKGGIESERIEYFAKPFDPFELLKKVKELLSRSDTP